MNSVVVVEYDPEWPRVFERLHAQIWPTISDLATAIEHVGSTSVPGLAAKPIIDLTVVVRPLATCRRQLSALPPSATNTRAI